MGVAPDPPGRAFRGTLLAKERLGFLEGGTDILVDALVAAARSRGTTFRTSTPVARVLHDGRTAKGLETTDGRKRHDFDYVVSAVPLPHFLRMTPDLPPHYQERLSQIDFIGVICVVLRTRKQVTENYWLNVNDPRIPFNGFIEYTNLNPGMTGDGTRIVYVPYYLPRNHRRFGLTDEATKADAIASLSIVNPSFGPGTSSTPLSPAIRTLRSSAARGSDCARRNTGRPSIASCSSSRASSTRPIGRSAERWSSRATWAG